MRVLLYVAHGLGYKYTLPGSPLKQQQTEVIRGGHSPPTRVDTSPREDYDGGKTAYSSSVTINSILPEMSSPISLLGKLFPSTLWPKSVGLGLQLFVQFTFDQL